MIYSQHKPCEHSALSALRRGSLLVLSFLIVAFGQPAWSAPLGLVSACLGVAIFLRVLITCPKSKQRFVLGFCWYTAVHFVHLSWMSAHDFTGLGILAGYAMLCLFAGAQFGLLCYLFSTRILKSLLGMAGFASIWTLMEWMRIFILSGYYWNPLGISLSGSIYGLQLSSLVGVYGMSWWVIFTNLFFLHWQLEGFRSIRPALAWICAALVPYLFGFAHIGWHQSQMAEKNDTMSAVLLQTGAVPASELKLERHALAQYAFDQWCEMLEHLKETADESVDLIAFPESAVPFSAYQSAYPLESVQEAVEQIFGAEALKLLPEEDPSLVRLYRDKEGQYAVVNNAFWAQTVANLFDADVVAGLQDTEVDGDSWTAYQAALHFRPQRRERPRYAKRLLVPVGEYIVDDPFGWCRSLAALHGLHSSFTAGKHAEIFEGVHAPRTGVSICYEEIFGDLMRENRLQGAEVLLNISNDGWYPNSRLPKQHFDHARLRSVENGLPMLRSCTTGITVGVDSLGRVVDIFGGDQAIEQQWRAGALRVELPRYSYSTLYTRLGDGLIVGISLMLSFLAVRYRYFYLPA